MAADPRASVVALRGDCDRYTTTQPAAQLVLRNISNGTTSIATCYCTQFAWSPDGNAVLYSVGTTYSVYNIATHSVFSFSGGVGSVPYWSPDSRFIVLDGLHTLTLITIASQTQQNLLSDNITDDASTMFLDTNALGSRFQTACGHPIVSIFFYSRGAVCSGKARNWRRWYIYRNTRQNRADTYSALSSWHGL